jgi:signal transduction histidine kinase
MDPAHWLGACADIPAEDHRRWLGGTNRAGVWTYAVMTAAVLVPLFWLDRVTFKALTGVVLLGMLAVAYRVRIHHIAEKMQERHRAQLAEHDQMTREIYDALLQSAEGLILKLHSVVDQLSPGAPQRVLLDAALDHAAELAHEARARIQDLREGARPRAEIGHVLETVASGMGQGAATRFELKVEGRVRGLRPYIWEELYRIGYEALLNAYRHARASRIMVYVWYGHRELLILIGDDGRGIAPAILQSAAAGGHFGLAGMQERARAVNARLHIESGEDGGTRIEIRINSPWSHEA